MQTRDTMGRSMRLHKKLKGKIEIRVKGSLKDKTDLSLQYTPGVGGIATHLAKNPKDTAKLTARGNMVAVVSDGSAVLGLGNIGPEGALPVMEGKAALFKHFAGVDAFPIVLSTQDPKEIVAAVTAIAPSFGAINLEDIAAPACFAIEHELRTKLSIPVMHDDQHGTAMVVLAGLINALKVKKIKEPLLARIVINGAGAAGMAIAEMLLTYGFKNIIMVDSSGAIYKGRAGLNAEKAKMAERTNKACLASARDARCATGGLETALKDADVFIGVSKAGALTPKYIALMREQPIIFALANPIPEILPDEAKRAGAYIVATGRSDFPNQLNNALGFPGIFRGALDNNVKQITDTMLVKAAIALAGLVKKPTPEKIIPSIFDKGVVKTVAKAIR